MIPSEYIYDNIITPLTLNHPVFIGPSPGLNTSHTCIIDTGAESNPKWLRDRYRFQVFGKYEAGDYASGYSDMQNIREAFLGLAPNTTSEGIWCQFILINGPSFIGVSESMHQFSMNLQATFDANSGVNRTPIE